MTETTRRQLEQIAGGPTKALRDISEVTRVQEQLMGGSAAVQIMQDLQRTTDLLSRVEFPGSQAREALEQLVKTTDLDDADSAFRQCVKSVEAAADMIRNGDSVRKALESIAIPRANYAQSIASLTGVSPRRVEAEFPDEDEDIQPPEHYVARLAYRTDLRQLIVDALERRGWSRRSVARSLSEQGVCSEDTVLRFLRGDQDARASVVAALLDEIGLVVKERHNS